MALMAIRKLLQKRRAKRRVVSNYIGIYDLETDDFVGHLSNRSRTGLMITSRKPFEPLQAYRLGVESGARQASQNLQAVYVQCLWARQEPGETFYYSGFRIEGAPTETTTQPIKQPEAC